MQKNNQNNNHLINNIIFFIAAASTVKSSKKTLSVASIFQQHMVLQRDLPVFIWSKSQAGSKITVAF